MTPETVVEIGQDALVVTLVMLLVLLIPTLVVGLLVSMLQAATQINEMTLSFIPKLLVTLGVMIIGGPWLLSTMMDYTRRLVENIPFLIG